MVNRKTSALIIAALLVSAPAQSRPALTPALIAQVPQSFPLPESVPSGTKVRISSGSDSTNQISEALGTGFEAQYPESTIAVATEDTAAAALQDVLNGNADLAAISRPLTAAEIAKGLVEVPVWREKIAIAVGKANPFTQSLTVSQFAQIFRGEIKDWSEVGGAAGPIRVIDRPDSSEIRQSLQPYPAFATTDFKTGDNATKLTEDSTAALAAALGNDGIGYAPIAELKNQPTTRALELHQTPPTDSQYPFSQPYSFVYAGGAPLEVAAFLGYSIGAPGQAILSQVNLAGSEARPSGADTGADGAATAAAGTTIEAGTSVEDESAVAADDLASAQTAAASRADTLTDGGRWWWLLLPLVGLGLFIWAASSRSSEEETAYAADATTDNDAIRSSLDGDLPSPATSAREDDLPPLPPASTGAAISTEPLAPETSTAVEEMESVPAASSPTLAGGVSAGEPALTEGTDIGDPRLSAFTPPNSGAQPDVISLESGASSWLDRAKTRINEATDQLKDTSAEDDLRKDS